MESADTKGKPLRCLTELCTVLVCECYFPESSNQFSSASCEYHNFKHHYCKVYRLEFNVIYSIIFYNTSVMIKCIFLTKPTSCPIWITTSFFLHWAGSSQGTLRLIKKKLRGKSPRTNYTDRVTAACRRSYCQLLRIQVATWSTWRILTAVLSAF
jgi:hypothetical protein